MNKFRYHVNEISGRFFGWNVTAVFKHDKARIQDIFVKFGAAADRNHRIVFAPQKKRRLIDQVRVGFDAVGIPVARRLQHRAMRVSRVQRAAN